MNIKSKSNFDLRSSAINRRLWAARKSSNSCRSLKLLLRLSCSFYGTQTPIFFTYDGHDIMGTVNNSCVVPNCRPNFCDKTGYYTVTLETPWRGYPIDNGYVQFFAQTLS